jgi:hypothetical protein
VASSGKGPALIAIGVGAALLWSAIKNEQITGVFRDIVQGKAPPANGPDELGPAASSSSSGQGTDASGTLPAATGSAAGNVAIGQMMAAQAGWTGPDWDYLRTGWMEESGWRTNAAFDKSDPFNHAYGIPQSNPGTKMASAGSDWKTNPRTQIAWGISYIKSRYGRPTNVPHWSASGPTAGYVGY